jgi:hypothetical protein
VERLKACLEYFRLRAFSRAKQQTLGPSRITGAVQAIINPIAIK